MVRKLCRKNWRKQMATVFTCKINGKIFLDDGEHPI
jgi:hypothetical protein